MSEMTPGAIATGIGFILFLTLISWGLAHLARKLPERIPRVAKVLVCGTLVQMAFLVVGYVMFVEESFLDWLLTRPTRAYFLVPGMLLLGCLAAWSVLRAREHKLDVGVFE
jgi:hypothetical protein